MQQAHLNINEVRTKVVTWGRWVEETPKTDQPEDIIVFITGNPGLTKFYNLFLQTLHEQTGLTVWAIGHAGHEPPGNATDVDVPPLKGNERLYGLKGQVDHKVSFIEKYVPSNARIHFVGHSVGTYIIVQLLRIPSISERVKGNYLLFPTVEHIADTPNGRFLTKFIFHILWLIYFLSSIFIILPSVLQNFLVYVYVKLNGIPTMHLKTISFFINPKILDKVFFMAKDEMDDIKQRDDEVIRANIKKIKLYYGSSDGWVPVSFYRNITRDIPEIQAQLCTNGYQHIFVYKNSRDVAKMTANWINEWK